jgi:hypothetical protein
MLLDCFLIAFGLFFNCFLIAFGLLLDCFLIAFGLLFNCFLVPVQCGVHKSSWLWFYKNLGVVWSRDARVTSHHISNQTTFPSSSKLVVWWEVRGR